MLTLSHSQGPLSRTTLLRAPLFGGRLWSCCLLVLISCCPAMAVEPLVWKFNVGDEHHYQMIQDMEMEMDIAATGKTMETTMRQTIDMTWKIEKVDHQGVATVLQQISRIQMDMQAPGQQKMHVDTDSEEPPAGFGAMLAPLFKVMVAEPFMITMTNRGEIKSVEVPKGFTEALKKAPGVGMMGEMFSGEGLKKMIQKSSIILPEAKDMELGHEWTQDSKLKMPPMGEIEMSATYAYQGPREVEKKRLEVFSIGMTMELGEGPGQFQIDIAGQKAHGEFLFDRELGRLDSSQLNQEMDLLITVGGQATTQKISQKMILKTVKKKSAK